MHGEQMLADSPAPRVRTVTEAGPLRDVLPEREDA